MPDSDEDCWVNLTKTDTRQQAEKYLYDRYGIESKDSSIFIVEGDNRLVKPA
jgi:hypothetical protein